MIKTLLIGCGNVGYNYDANSNENIQTHFKAIYKNKNFDLVCTIDKSQEKQLIIQKKFGIDCVNDICEIDKSKIEDLDLIVISTSDEAKIKTLSQILDLGLNPKAILYEKPIAQTISEMEQFCKLVKDTKSEFRFNFIRRADPSYQWLNKNFKNIMGADCKLNLEINFSGGLHNVLSHGVDFLLGFLGREKFSDLQISKLKNIWLVANKYFDLIIKQSDIGVSIFEVTMMSEKAKIHYSHTNEKIIITEVGPWYDFKGKFFTLQKNSLKLRADKYMLFTYKELINLISTGNCALTNIDDAKLIFNLIEELK